MNVRQLIINVFIVCLLLSIKTTFAQKPEASELKPPVFANNLFSFPWFNDGWNTKRLSPDNPDKQIVFAEISTLIARYKKSGFATAAVSEPVQLKTDALRRLFPNHRFYLIGWDEQPVKGKEVMGLGYGIYYNLIVGINNEITKLSGSGNFEEYGQFLSKNEIKIKNAEDARLVWLAFCDIHQKLWHSRNMKQVSATEWHLGLYQTDDPFRKEQFHYWYQVILDDNQKVMSAKLAVERIVK